MHWRIFKRCLVSSGPKAAAAAFILIVMGLVVNGDNEGAEKSNKRKISKNHPVLIVISFDGFRFNYFGRVDTPNLDSLKSSGVSVDYMRNQFVTKTFPNHMSIATGLHVESHGVVDNWIFDPLYNVTLGPGSPLFWNPDNQTLPLWTLNEMAGEGRRSGVMMWPGSNFPYGPSMKLPSRWKAWDETKEFESRVDEVIEWVTDEQEPVNLVFMYFEEPDEYAHAFGPESDVVTKLIQKLDNTTGYLIKKLKSFGIFDEVNIMLLSDHGFQEVKQQNMINISTILNKDDYHQFGSTPVLHILPKQDKFDEIYSALKNASVGNSFDVYTKKDMVKSWHYVEHRRIMPIVLVADIGFVFDDFAHSIHEYNIKFNITPNMNRVYGVHGYDNRLLPMHPFFISHGPLFKSRFVASPFDNIDLFPLICKIMQISAPPNNGSLIDVQYMLKSNRYSLQPWSMGWIIGSGALIGFLILFAIMALLISSSGSKKIRTDFKRSFNQIQGYRFVNIRREGNERSGEDGEGMTAVVIKGTSQEERVALLCESSTEEI